MADAPAAAGPVRVAFILSLPRSGSTWLGAVLGSLSWARALGEFDRFFEPGSTATCTTCAADGLPDCTRLHGIREVDPDDAFAFAAERLGTPVLIDASKSVPWARRFAARPDLDVRLVHLVRNPCGYLESMARRRPDLPPESILDGWEKQNRRIEALAAEAGRPSILACYDTLADDPDRAFPPLCEALGGPWEPGALDYGRTEHHGLGGNGAASLWLRGRPHARVASGDGAFYARLAERPTAADRRWQDRLAPELVTLALDRPYARGLAARLGTDWRPRPA